MSEENMNNTWPLPKFYFSVKFGSQDNAARFQEVSGLNVENQIIEYRHGDGNFSTIKMPGIVKFSNATLKKGVFVNDNCFLEWFNAFKMNTIKRETVTIQLFDEAGNPTMTWKLLNAWPTRITGFDIKSDANE
ncbi:MAG: phage tail protein, partial [Bacteroidales bacterium]